MLCKEARDRAFAAGCTEHLTKPIKKATLLEAINRHAPSDDAIHVEVEDGSSRWSAAISRNAAPMLPSCARLSMQGDYAIIRTLGHQMAGTGGGYGFDPITEIGSALEDSALASRRRADSRGHRRPGPLSKRRPSEVKRNRDRQPC